MATRQSLRNAARQSGGQPTTKAKTGRAAAKSAPAAKKATATKALSKGAAGSKRSRLETPERDGQTSQPDVLSPSEKRTYDRLKAKMEQAEKQAAAERRANIHKTSTAMLLAENASGGEDDEDEDEQPRRKKLKKNKEIRSSDDEEQDELVEEEEEEAMQVEPEETEMDAAPPRAKPKPRPAYGKKSTDKPEVEDDPDDGTRPTLDPDERSLARALGENRSSSAKGNKASKAKQRNNRDDRDSASDDGEERRPAVTQPAKGKKVLRMDAVVIDSPPKRVKNVVDKNKGKGTTIEKKKKPKKRSDWLDTDTESENETGTEVDEVEEDDEPSSDSDEVSEESSEDEGTDEDSGDDVIVVKAPKGKTQRSKGKGGRRSRGSADRPKSEGRRRAQARDIPETLRPVVTCSQMYLRLRLSLNHAWTAEKMQNSSQLPDKHRVIKRALRDARKHRAEDGKKIAYLVSGFKTLRAKGNNNLRKMVASVVWTGASQLRNEVKKKAKTVVDNAYGLGSLSTQRRVAAATFLLKSNTQGKYSMQNFIFGDIDIAWQSDEPHEVDMKASVVNRKKPFQHRALSDVIVQHWFHGHRDTASVAAYDRFSEVPDNLIALVCNAIEAALVDIATGTHQFSNKLYAPKWGNVMGILDQFKHNAPAAYQLLKEMIWTNVSALVDEHKAPKKDAQDDDDAGSSIGEQFIAWSDIEVGDTTATTKAAKAAAKPSSSSAKAATKPSSSSAKAATKPSSSSSTRQTGNRRAAVEPEIDAEGSAPHDEEGPQDPSDDA